MTAGTKIRNLMRLLDASDAPVWAIDNAGKLVYLSAATARWLGVDVERLLQRRAVAGSPVSNDPLNLLAATLSPPPGLKHRGTASLRVQPVGDAKHRIEPIDVRFVRIGSDESGLTIAIGGRFSDRVPDEEIADAAIVRQQLDAWRKRHASIATVATAGVSSSAKRMRARIQVAATVRTHIGFFGPPGCSYESIAQRIHQQSAPREAIAIVDGPLMDPELLDASIVPAVNQLANSADAKATVLVRGLDEMPLDAQRHLVQLIGTFNDRLRLLGLCRDHAMLHASADVDTHDDVMGIKRPERQLDAAIADLLASLTVTIEPLATRVEDIPLLAAALVDAHHAAGDGVGERLSRAAIDALVIYPWPNNFEELDAAMRHAVRSATRDSIGPENFPLAIRSFRPGDTLSRRKVQSVSLDEMLEAFELKMIKSAVEASDGNRAAAARLLGITRSRLLRRIDAVDSDSTKSSPRSPKSSSPSQGEDA
ncbi:helix-turn-helix domain-containing protein [Novipirellula sp. SH528]|uniref:helix-turn-helix domain-containing protein n=1 Tax=Novipirellula sp. SH528 TaxID=3454466 RepID=UPI003FA04F50